MAITRQFIKQARSDMQADLAEVAKKHNVVITVGSASFTDDNVTFKVTLSAIAADGTVKTKEAAAYERYQTILGLKPLGSTFTQRGKTYEICGYNPRCRKFPVIAKDVASGKSFKFMDVAAK